MSDSKEQFPVGPDCPPLALIDEEGHGSSSFPELDLPPDPVLVAQGWVRRFMADPLRAEETTRLYLDLGFEVHSEPVKPDELSAECGDCRLIACKTYVTIYTRKPTN